ncbi:tyrosine-type recombinase/integrase [Limnoglobus roseus]|uniref:Site-specific integrase n=1 Tax=Limnoglobus roseus TaxID=2598579 RepID=A0A5C1A7M2_9BACT|nr:site-specific integrase [Limnoglobus roseus]QEL14730.1 site-specific integrase [Limnoglobus roseus]
MARKPSIWFREQTGWYMTTYRGEQIKLSTDKKEAEKAFHTLLASEEPQEETGGLRPSFHKLADLFLQEAARTKEPETVKVQTVYLQSFCDFIGKRKATDIKVHHVTEWLISHNKPGKARGPRKRKAKPEGSPEPVRFQSWGESTRTTARSILRACLNWAFTEGYIASNPLAKLKRGSYARRERILTADERKKVREWLPEGVREFIIALEKTGARPFSELAKVTAEMIDWPSGTITFLKHKTAKKGKKRVVYLTEELQAVLRKLAESHPTGPIFRTRTGIAWGKGTVSKWMRKVEKALGIPRLNPYAWRHTYITDSLAKGMSADIVAELVGNSPATISKYYSHLDQKGDTLREAAKRAAG